MSPTFLSVCRYSPPLQCPCEFCIWHKEGGGWSLPGGFQRQHQPSTFHCSEAPVLCSPAGLQWGLPQTYPGLYTVNRYRGITKMPYFSIISLQQIISILFQSLVSTKEGIKRRQARTRWQNGRWIFSEKYHSAIDYTTQSLVPNYLELPGGGKCFELQTSKWDAASLALPVL